MPSDRGRHQPRRRSKSRSRTRSRSRDRHQRPYHQHPYSNTRGISDRGDTDGGSGINWSSKRYRAYDDDDERDSNHRRHQQQHGSGSSSYRRTEGRSGDALAGGSRGRGMNRYYGHEANTAVGQHQQQQPYVIPDSAPRVQVPSYLPLELKRFIDVFAGYVQQGGTPFEEAVKEREKNNPFFAFLRDPWNAPATIYYRWRLYSLLQGDTFSSWRTEPFQIEKGEEALVIIPPLIPTPGPPPTSSPFRLKLLQRLRTAESITCGGGGGARGEEEEGKEKKMELEMLELKPKEYNSKSGVLSSPSQSGVLATAPASDNGTTSSNNRSSSDNGTGLVSSTRATSTTAGAQRLSPVPASMMATASGSGTTSCSTPINQLLYAYTTEGVVGETYIAESISKENALFPALSSADLAKWTEMIQNLDLQREKIADCMVFAIDRAEQAYDLMCVLIESLTVPGLSAAKSLARLFALSDILSNCYATSSVSYGKLLSRAGELAVIPAIDAIVSNIIQRYKRLQPPEKKTDTKTTTTTTISGTTTAEAGKGLLSEPTSDAPSLQVGHKKAGVLSSIQQQQQQDSFTSVLATTPTAMPIPTIRIGREGQPPPIVSPTGSTLAAPNKTGDSCSDQQEKKESMEKAKGENQKVGQEQDKNQEKEGVEEKEQKEEDSNSHILIEIPVDSEDAHLLEWIGLLCQLWQDRGCISLKLASELHLTYGFLLDVKELE